MSDQANPFEKLMLQRMEVINELSTLNAKYLRLIQLSSGNDILLMKEPNSGHANKTQSNSELEIEKCQAELDVLELKILKIDKEIKTTIDKDK